MDRSVEYHRYIATKVKWEVELPDKAFINSSKTPFWDGLKRLGELPLPPPEKFGCTEEANNSEWECSFCTMPSEVGDTHLIYSLKCRWAYNKGFQRWLPHPFCQRCCESLAENGGKRACPKCRNPFTTCDERAYPIPMDVQMKVIDARRKEQKIEREERAAKKNSRKVQHVNTKDAVIRMEMDFADARTCARIEEEAIKQKLKGMAMEKEAEKKNTCYGS